VPTHKHRSFICPVIRDKRSKKWGRAWELELIKRHNPQWRGLSEELRNSAFLSLSPEHALGPAFRRNKEISRFDARRS
jgi:hypothetical protein